MTWNPLFSAPHLLATGVVLLGGVLAASWHTARRCGLPARVTILASRSLLMAGLVLVALNPGHWIDRKLEQATTWSILVDRSLSMTTEDVGQESRWTVARRLADELKRHSGHPERVTSATFAGELDASPAQAADGEKSDLPAAMESLLDRGGGKLGRLSGVAVFTDGRQTAADSEARRQQVQQVALRARARQVPLFAIPLGGAVRPKDLEVSSTRRQFIAFAGQQASLSATIRSEGLGSIRPEIRLEDREGKVLDRRTVELSAAQRKEVAFTIAAPEAGTHSYRFRVPAWEGERVTANNESAFALTVLQGKIRAFMTEGVPYWDSKFLAQFMRQQENMLVTSVYRLSGDRYFRVETGDEQPSEASGNIFPSTAEELNAYDLLVFGKGADYFLTPERMALIDGFVRERGGALLFTRGKPYSGEFESLSHLEPVQWGAPISSPFRLRPTEAGVASGLFGALLPGRDDAIWRLLPDLEQANALVEIKPFSQVLLEGRSEEAAGGRPLPVLVSRRYGKGLLLVLNADGLWKWDFFPEKGEVEDHYKKFWGQLMQWAVTYSEFLPGQNLALHLNESVVYPDASVSARLFHRFTASSADAKPPRPALRIYRGETLTRRLDAVPPSRGADSWEANFTLSEPGSYRVEAWDAAAPDEPGPSLPLTVLPPPGERDQLSADPDFLRQFAAGSGGDLVDAPADLAKLARTLDGEEATVDLGRAEWEPAWARPWFLGLLLFFPSLEWLIRRRNGLL